MPKQTFTAAEAARALGISLDTLRRWDRSGRIKVERDANNRRTVPAAEIERLRGAQGSPRLSPRNRMVGIVRSVRVEGLVAQIEIDVTEPARIVALITADAAAELALAPGMPAAAMVKSTSVMIER